MSSSKPRRVVIIGAGFGGLACARKLADRRDVHLTIVDRTNHHLFQPLLYQVASSTLSIQDISRSLRSIFSRAKYAEHLEIRFDHVKRIDLSSRSIYYPSGELLHYDDLVVATGARTSFFGNDHWADFVYELKSAEDALAIRQQVLRNLELAERIETAKRQKLTNIIIVGGGPTGVELAGAFADLIKRNLARNFRNFDAENQRIILIEAQSRLLTAFATEQSEYTRKHLENQGVEVRLNSMVNDIQKGQLTLKDGETIHSDIIIWAAGVEGTPLVRTLGVELTRSGQVPVDENLAISGYPEVSVIGDTAAVIQQNGSPVPGVAPAATQEGTYVAQKIIREIEGDKRKNPFRYRDKGKMAIVGKGSAVVEIGGWRTKGWLGWSIWLLVHLLFLIDFRSKLGVLSSWLWAYVRNTPGSRVFPSNATKDIQSAEDPPIDGAPAMQKGQFEEKTSLLDKKQS